MSGDETAKGSARWLARRAAPVRGTLAASVSAGACDAGLLIAQAFLLAHVVARAVLEHVPPSKLATPLALLLGIFVLRAASVHVRERAAARAAREVKRRVREELVAHVFSLGPDWSGTQSAGTLATTVVDGVEALHDYYARYLPQTALAVIVPAAVLAVVFPIDWISGLILAGTAPLIPVFMILVGRGAQALNERQWSRLARLAAHFHEVLSGLPTLKAFGAGKAQEAAVKRLGERYRAGTMSVLRVAFLSALALEFLATMSIAMVAVLVGFRLLWGDLAFAAGLTALLLAPEFYLPLRELGQVRHARMAAVAAAGHMTRILEQPAPRWTGRRPYAPRGAPRIAFDGVSFAYERGRVLHGVSFAAAESMKLAIVGPSGAGKSTLLHLLLGFAAPLEGRILVDGRPLAELALDDWRRALAWVPQRTRLFAGTIGENIRLGRPDADEAAVREAARRAAADDFIEALPHGYATALGEDGAGLSGGEIRRISLARAFLRGAPLLVMDEPTASLDAESEAAVGRALETLTRRRTVVTVAHRLQTVIHADRIVFLADGRVAAAGEHATLVRDHAGYRRFVSGLDLPERPA